jgi:cobalt-zinc-cadmium efflux system protein
MGDNHSHGGHSHSHGNDAKNIGIAFFLNFSFTILELAGGGGDENGEN